MLIQQQEQQQQQQELVMQHDKYQIQHPKQSSRKRAGNSPRDRDVCFAKGVLLEQNSWGLHRRSYSAGDRLPCEDQKCTESTKRFTCKGCTYCKNLFK